jgi:glycine/D-amino acid oxidase-like deaminating enzyme
LKAELAARRAAGFDCEWLERAELGARFGCHRPGAILSGLGAELDPLRFTHSLLRGAERHGVELFARSRVRAIEQRGAALRLVTASTHTVDAGHVIVAAGYESLDFLDREVAEVHNTYAVVTEPLADRRRIDALPLLWETARPYLYVRGTPDGRLMVGGADIRFKDAAARDLALPRQARRLARSYRDLFGAELPSIAGAWGGSFASTADGLPFIGSVPGMHPRLLFALCFGGNGITFSVLAAQMIRAAVEERGHELAGLFGFARAEGVSSIAPRRGRDNNFRIAENFSARPED